MATVTAFIRTTKKNTSTVHVRFRLRDGRNIQLFHKSGIEVEPELWDPKKESYKAKVLIEPIKREKFNKDVSGRKNLLMQIYNQAEGSRLDSKAFEELIDQTLHPEKYNIETEKKSFFELFDQFLEKRDISEERKEGYMVIKRTLQRYEMVVALEEERGYILDVDEVTHETLEDIESFFRNEHTLSEEYQHVYETIPEYRKQKQRGQNRINDMMSRLRTFFHWAVDTEKTTNTPFKKSLLTD